MDFDWQDELIREPVVEGLFYPDDPDELRKNIQEKISSAEEIPANPAGIVVPCAALDFSGKISAEAFKRCSGVEYKRIVILASAAGQSESAYFLPESTHFRTPLGISPVDLDALRILSTSSTIGEISEIEHLQAHCIEITLPWVQYLFPDVPIVPILIRVNGGGVIHTLASALQYMDLELQGDTLFIAAANLAGPLPPDIAATQAGRVIEMMYRGDSKHMLAEYRSGTLVAPGIPVLAVAAELMHRFNRIERLKTGNSADHDSQASTVVEYAAFSYERGHQSSGSKLE